MFVFNYIKKCCIIFVTKTYLIFVYKVGGGILLAVILSSVEMNADETNKVEAIYNKYKNILYYKALNIVKKETDAEDILQEAFIKIAKNIKAVKNIDSKETASFLIVIVKNTAYDYIRKTSKKAEFSLEETQMLADEKALDNLVGNIEYQEIVAIISNIPSPYNEVLYLHYVKEYSIKQTADLLDKKIATVKMQLVRGKRVLTQKLSEVLYG